MRILFSIFAIALIHPAWGDEPLGPSRSSIDLLQKLVQQNSATSNLEGLERVRQLLIPEFEALGFSARLLEAPEDRKVLSFSVPGGRPLLMMLGHIDTVFDPADPSPQKFKVNGDRIEGPGVIDMKGGIVLMLDLLRELPLRQRRRIRVVLNDQEEKGSMQTRMLLKERTTGIREVLVYEPGLPNGNVVTSHSGVKWVQVDVHGKSAHAGLEHEKGYNACVELSQKMVLVSELTDYSKKLTLNVGVMNAGSVPNAVCELASAKIDIRYVERADLKFLEERLEKIVLTQLTFNPHLEFEPKMTIKTLAQLPSMPNSASKNLMRKAQEVAAKHGTDLHGQHVGYASDGNLLADLDLDILVGLGPHGGGMHTKQEFMSRASYTERLKLNRQLIQKLLTQKEGSK